MLTFLQFISEKELYDISGWMSPSGKPHIFSGEHAEHHHPEYLKHAMKVPREGYPNKKADFKTLHHAQERGFVRFGRKTGGIHGNHYFVHYDADHPKGHQTALRALEYLHPEHNDPVAVSGDAGMGWGALEDLKQPVASREAHRHLYNLAHPS